MFSVHLVHLGFFFRFITYIQECSQTNASLSGKIRLPKLIADDLEAARVEDETDEATVAIVLNQWEIKDAAKKQQFRVDGVRFLQQRRVSVYDDIVEFDEETRITRKTTMSRRQFEEETGHQLPVGGEFVSTAEMSASSAGRGIALSHEASMYWARESMMIQKQESDHKRKREDAAIAFNQRLQIAQLDDVVRERMNPLSRENMLSKMTEGVAADYEKYGNASASMGAVLENVYGNLRKEAFKGKGRRFATLNADIVALRNYASTLYVLSSDLSIKRLSDTLDNKLFLDVLSELLGRFEEAFSVYTTMNPNATGRLGAGAAVAADAPGAQPPRVAYVSPPATPNADTDDTTGAAAVLPENSVPPDVQRAVVPPSVAGLEELAEIVDVNADVWDVFCAKRHQLEKYKNLWIFGGHSSVVAREVQADLQVAYKKLFDKKDALKMVHICKVLRWPAHLSQHNGVLVQWAQLLMSNADWDKFVVGHVSPKAYKRNCVLALRKAAVFYEGFGDLVPPALLGLVRLFR